MTAIEAGAPGAEIEITPAMTLAGAIAFGDADPRVQDIRERLALVFRAMVLAREQQAEAGGKRMKYQVTFADGVATVSLHATLPIPQLPLAVPENRDGKRRPSALDQIEALAPEALSDILFPRIAQPK